MQDATEIAISQTDDQAEYERLLADAESKDQSEFKASLEETQPSATQGEKEEVRAEADAQPEPEAKQTNQPDNPETSADQKNLPDELHTEQQTEGQKQETNYQKARKDEARLARNWKRLEAEKESFRQQQAELQQQAQQFQSQQFNPAQQPRINSRHFAEYAQKAKAESVRLFKEGDIEKGLEQLDLAEKAVESWQQYAYAEQQEAQQYQLQQGRERWLNDSEKVINQVPELGDAETELSQQMVELLEDKPYYGMLPNGFSEAWERLQERRVATEVSGLREENTKLKQENERYRKLTNLTGEGGPGSHSGTTPKLDKMSDEEQERYLQRQAELMDASA